MDVLTQGLLGSALAQSGSRKNELKLATLIGFVSGLLADADVLIRSTSDPLLTIEYHRHFTHSIFFVPIGALVAALLLWPLTKKHLSFRRLYLFSLLGYSLSGFIDLCTSYGTYYFWPLYDQRLSLHIISIVDPIFTGVLLVAVAVAFYKLRQRAAHLGLVVCGLYLVLGWIQLQRAESVASELAESRGHEVSREVSKPTLGNILLWRSTYITGDRIYVDGIRVGLFGPEKIYEGDSVPLFKPERDAGIGKKTVLYQDMLRFQKFSDGFVSVSSGKSEIMGDIRYGLLPNSTKPLWGIVYDRRWPDRHVRYDFFRTNTPEMRQSFYHMVLGKDLPEP